MIKAVILACVIVAALDWCIIAGTSSHEEDDDDKAYSGLLEDDE